MMGMGAEIERMVVRLMGDITPYQQSLKQAGRDTARFASGVTGEMAKAKLSFASLGSGLTAFRKDLSRHVLTLGAIGGGIAVGAVAWGVRLAAQAEQAAISFEVMLGSANEARKVMASLRDFAARTPLEMPEITAAAKQLLAFGTPVERLIPTLTMLGDVAQGLGQPIGELTYLFGKARVADRLFMQDVNQFTERGIPIVQELAKAFGVMANDIRSMVEKGKIHFSDLERAFGRLTGSGGQFENMMARQSKTVIGLWSTLKDNVNYALMQIGQTLLQEIDFKGLTTDAIRFAETIDKTVVPAFKNFLRGTTQSLTAVQILWVRLKAEMEGFGAFIGELVQGFLNIQEWFWKGMQGPAPDWFGKGYEKQLDMIAADMYTKEKALTDDYLKTVADQVTRDMPLKTTDQTRRSVSQNLVPQITRPAKQAVAISQDIQAARVGTAEAMSRITAWRSGLGLDDATKETAKNTTRMVDLLSQIAAQGGVQLVPANF